VKKIIVMTGATHGFGFHAIKSLAENADTIVLMVRNIERGKHTEKLLKDLYPKLNIDLLLGDFSDSDSVNNFLKNLVSKYSKIDVLINNAGAVLSSEIKDSSGMPMNQKVNFVSPAKVCLGVKPILSAGAVVINTVSIGEHLGKFDLRQISEGVLTTASYPQAKRALLLFTLALNRHWADLGIIVKAFHPKIVLPLDDKPVWLKKVLLSTISQSPETVGKSLATLAIEPGKHIYSTVGEKPAKASRAALLLRNQELIFDWVNRLI